MNLNDKISLDIEVGTLAVLISALYVVNTGIPIEAIPSSVFIEVAEKMVEFLPIWDYDAMSFEEWVSSCLMIYPSIMFSEEELKEYESNPIFICRQLGNAELIATAKVSICTNTL